MIADGLFDRFPCDEIYALHNNPNGPRGFVGMRSGPAMAAADFFDIRINGRGAHAAEPHQSIDPIAAGLALAQSLQTIVGRNVDPLHAAVLSITKFVGGNTYNVIPESVEMAGTVRTFNADARHRIAARMREICEGVAKAYGVTIDADIRDMFSILENWPEQTKAAAAVAVELFGPENVDSDAPPFFTSEDFADMLKIVPGAYVRLGQAEGPGLHNASYVFDDELIPTGALLLATLLQKRSVVASA
jgi:hippurate hydrolase